MRASEDPRLRFGVILHVYLHSPEVAALRTSARTRPAYLLWLHLSAQLFKGKDTWGASMSSLADDFGVSRSTVQRWAALLEAAHLVEREVGAPEPGQPGLSPPQRWHLLVPPSCRGVEQPAANQGPPARRRAPARRLREVRAELARIRRALDQVPDLDAWDARVAAELDRMPVALRAAHRAMRAAERAELAAVDVDQVALAEELTRLRAAEARLVREVSEAS